MNDLTVGTVDGVTWIAPAGMGYEEWAQIGRTFQTIGDAINFWVGDWLNYGEARYGERYVQAIEATGWKLERLQQAKWVCGRVKPCTRVQGLSFTHHRLVAKLADEEQEQWLMKAATKGWRSGELKAALSATLSADLSAVLDVDTGDTQEDDDVPYSGSGPDNYDMEAPEAVMEYEQQAGEWDEPLPVLSRETMEQVERLVRCVLLGEWSDALALANGLRWMNQEDD